VDVKKLLSWIVFAVVAGYGGMYLFNHLPQIAQPATPPPTTTLVKDSDPAVKYVGPLADYTQGERSSDSDNDSRPKAEWKADASDIVGDSPTGTGGVILHKTFSVASTAKFPFEIPAHATNPQLRGNYRSFLPATESATGDDAANLEFLLMSEQQYAVYAKGGQADISYFVQSSHNQQVNVTLSPTFDKPARYCLVFRNRSGGVARKNVQADFSVEF
jgi:hypothetical protein